MICKLRKEYVIHDTEAKLLRSNSKFKAGNRFVNDVRRLEQNSQSMKDQTANIRRSLDGSSKQNSYSTRPGDKIDFHIAQKDIGSIDISK